MELADHIVDAFRAFGPIQLKRMFSGYGLFRGGVMFGLLHDDVLYLKADLDNVADFVSLGLAQFTYVRNGKTVGLSYYQAPDSVMDDGAEAAKWAQRSFEAALRGGASKAKAVRKRTAKSRDVMRNRKRAP
ncbi:TfoX/Sxy family protein [Hyphomicrobium sp. LHD-15]|uniref:TfoX/Sxy family protein n=1 Tax=Hyphomicrobium sp. LHD-15 TaxID=3072142 RepID=UPI00280E8139|nr:TfoX/Sxy family protein [Hyphomicrobium sp. LHD-15]MDQ8698453.1 TfoX/Sxy family protein [Hyphomicrobium sp. LHD-15]